MHNLKSIFYPVDLIAETGLQDLQVLNTALYSTLTAFLQGLGPGDFSPSICLRL